MDTAGDSVHRNVMVFAEPGGLSVAAVWAVCEKWIQPNSMLHNARDGNVSTHDQEVSNVYFFI